MSNNISFKRIGILGGGKMGMSLFDYISKYDEYDLIFYIRNEEKLNQIKTSYQRKLAQKQKKLGNDYVEQKEMIFTNDLDDLADTEIVFEFISEDVKIKEEVIENLVLKRKDSGLIIATGSSSLVPSKISKDYLNYNLYGTHFIYPIQFMKTVEVVYGCGADGKTVEKIKNFLNSIGRRPIPVHEDIGAFTIRIISRIFMEAFDISIEMKIPFHVIDRLVSEEDFAAPPFDLCDSVGLEIILNSLKALYGNTKEFPCRLTLLKFLEDKINKGHSGKKKGMGIFDYNSPNSENNKSDEFDLPQEIIDLIIDRLKLVYVITCFKLMNVCCLDSDTIDEVMCELYSTKKGPVQIAYEYGLENVLNKLNIYKERYGDWFEPVEILRYGVDKNVGRDELDRQIRLFIMAGKWPDWYPIDIKQTI